jgi:small-conductance mechanosensitive channel
MSNIFNQINFGLDPQLQTQILSSLFIILGLWLLRLLVMLVVNASVDGAKTRYKWRKTSTYITVILGFILISPLWLSFDSLTTFMGLAIVGLIIALQGPLNDLAGWILIIWRHPFEVGSRIEIGEHAGDVVDIRIFQFTPLEIGNWVHADQSTGRVLHIPNRKVLSETLANYNHGLGYIWHEIEVHLTFESHWEKAKSILEDVASRDAAHLSPDAAERVRRAARRFLIYYPKLTPIVYTRVETSGVLLTLRYLCEPRRRRSTEQAIWEDVLKAFAEHPDIEFAYPTQRFYQRSAEKSSYESREQGVGSRP